MRIEIEIPKEFEEYFKKDKFKDSFERIVADIKHSLENGNCLCAGRYEHEIIEMLEKAFENSKSAYSVDKVVDELEKIKGLACRGKSCSKCEYTSDCFEGEQSQKVAIDKAIEIVKQGAVSDDVCEWKVKSNYYVTKCSHDTDVMYGLKQDFKFCPYCSKKIKVVQ